MQDISNLQSGYRFVINTINVDFFPIQLVHLKQNTLNLNEYIILMIAKLYYIVKCRQCVILLDLIVVDSSDYIHWKMDIKTCLNAVTIARDNRAKALRKNILPIL